MGSSKPVRPPWWLKPANKVFIQMSRLGMSFGGESPVVLTVPGRKSGRERSTPVTPMTVDGREYVIAGFPGADWVANARAAGQATVARGRTVRRVTMVELSADDARPLLRVFPTEVPDRCRIHEAVRPGHRGQARGIRGAGRPLRGVPTGRNSIALSDNPFHGESWKPVDGFGELTDITYHRHVTDATVRVAFNRPEIRNAFRPHTVDELYRVLDHARMSPDVGVVLLTGNGPSPKDGGWAFCSGGDQRIRGRSGYQYASGETADTVDAARAGRLHILEVQRLIRFMPKVVICLVNGWAAGGGHSLHVVCDLTLASREHARFKQTDADVGSFDGGYGSAYLARQVGQKFAREVFFLGRDYTAEQMHAMGAVNAVVDHAELEAAGVQWAAEINAKSPQAQRMLKYAFNLLDDGLVGQQLFAGEATRLAYMTDEAVEGRDAFLEKRPPDWNRFPRYF